MSSFYKKLLLLGVVTLGIIPVIETAYHFYIKSSIPTAKEWETVKKIVAENFAKGDLIMIKPEWAEEGWVWLGQFQEIKDRAFTDYRLYERVWLVYLSSFYDISKDADKYGTILKRFSTKNISIIVYKVKDRVKPMYSFIDHFEEAKVYLEDHKTGSKCNYIANNPWRTGISKIVQRGGFECRDRNNTFYIAPVIFTDRSNQPRYCIHILLPKYIKLVIEYNNVPYGKFVTGYLGMHYNQWSRGGYDPQRPPVMMLIETKNSSFLFTITQKEAWKQFLYELKYNTYSNLDIRFLFFSQENKRQESCFTAWVTDTKPKELINVKAKYKE